MNKRLLKTLIGILIGAILILLVNLVFSLGLDPYMIGIVTTTILLLHIFARPWIEKRENESEIKSTKNVIIRVVLFILIIIIMATITFVGETLNLGSSKR
ncbi:hypothetical protein ACI2JA_16400 [Alkalihalobacillus sp. NPDC078783]